MSHKSETHHFLWSFIKLVTNQFDQKVKKVQSNNGEEFSMTNCFQANDIFHQTSYVDTPQQNGVVECKHRHLLNVAHTLRFQAHLPIQFWGDCILIVVYLINRTPSLVQG